MSRLGFACFAVAVLGTSASPVIADDSPVAAATYPIPPSALSLRVALGGDKRFIQSVTLVPSNRAEGWVEMATVPGAVGHMDSDPSGVTFTATRVSGAEPGVVRYVVHVPCCLPLDVRVGFGSLSSESVPNVQTLTTKNGSLTVLRTEGQGGAIVARVESGSLTLSAATLSDHTIDARVANGSLNANLPLGSKVDARVENGPPSTWATGTSIDAVPTVGVRTTSRHGAALSIPGTSSPTTLTVVNGLIRIRLAPSATP
jgi:hypothetical protein